MATTTMSLASASIVGTAAESRGGRENDGVVEINLLLPEQWAHDLMTLSRQRHQSVGQIIRSMIGHALHEDATPC